jgi:hypothetical protein
MTVTAAGWQSEKERRYRIIVKVVIDNYSKDIEFTGFKGLQGRGLELVMDKPWLRLHNRKHNIEICNEMWITDSADQNYDLLGLRPDDDERTATAKDLVLHTITWREAQILSRWDKKVNFFLARATKVDLGKHDQAIIGRRI